MDLKKKIEIEDKKSNRTTEGVSAESLERMNPVQDSICLELRSELVSVVLQIRKLAPGTIPAQLIQQYDNLRYFQSSNPAEVSFPQGQSGKRIGKTHLLPESRYFMEYGIEYFPAKKDKLIFRR